MSRLPAASPTTEPIAASNLRPAGDRRWRWLLTAGLIAASASASLLYSRLAFDPLREARAAHETGKDQAALRFAQQVLKRRPDDRDAALLAARSLTRLGFGDQADSYYQKAGSLADGLADLHDRAFALARSDQPQRAVVLYERILARSPDDPLALKRLAEVHMGGKRWKPVLEMSGRLERIPGGEVDAATLAAIAHHELRHYEQAIAAGKKVLELDPELKATPLPRSLFWNNLALDLLALGRTADAEAYLTAALRGSEDSNLRERLGLACFQQGAVDRAENHWRQAIEWDPRNADALLGLGRLALNRNRPREALTWLERAVEASPEALEPVYNLARAHRLLGQTAEAERLERRAADLRAQRPVTGGMGEMPEPGR